MIIATVILAAYLNRASASSLVLLGAVAAGVLYPWMPGETDCMLWFMGLAIVEMSVMVIAAVTDCRAAEAVMLQCFVLALTHLTELMMWPDNYDGTMYPLIVQVIEYTQVLTLCVLAGKKMEVGYGPVVA